jgi:D-3-phosphoglycerate dehydrogenase
MSGRRPTVAILGTRYTDFSLEREVLGSSVEIVSGPGGSPDEILEVAADADVIVAGSRPRFDADVIGGLSCAAIVRAGIGVDSVDLDAARSARIWVANVPDYGTEAVAFHAVALALAGLRRIVEADSALKAGGWGFDALRPLHLPSTLTVGVVGLGRIGRKAASMFSGLGVRRVLGHDPFVETVPDVEVVSLESLLETSDVVSLHAPGPPEGTPLLGPDELERMREGSVLVNTARGSLVDGAALVRSMEGGRPRIAALDTFEVEPPDLAGFSSVSDRLIVTPHMAWYTEESQEDMRRKAAEEALRVLGGSAPLNPVVDL